MPLRSGVVKPFWYERRWKRLTSRWFPRESVNQPTALSRRSIVPALLAVSGSYHRVAFVKPMLLWWKRKAVRSRTRS